jgi:predicted transglutaminase-like cysteine proteinase
MCFRRSVLFAAAMLVAAPAAAADLVQSRPAQPSIYVIGTLGPNMLGTTTVPIRADRFNGSWAHAMQDASRSPSLLRLVAPARRLSRIQQVAYVQSRVHNSIRWISDATEWGQHDYWATASETLAHGAGDMEDRAIVKMHALRALGFNAGDLFLTMGRDQVGGPMTVLVARLGGRFYVLDDTGGSPFPIESRRKEFKPLLSFGFNGVWAHTMPVSAPLIRTASAAAFNRSGRH